MQMHKCVLQLHELVQDFVKSEISKLFLFPYHHLFALSPAHCPICPLVPASLPCGRPHCTYRLISELSRAQHVQKVDPKIVVNVQVSPYPSDSQLMYRTFTPQVARLMRKTQNGSYHVPITSKSMRLVVCLRIYLVN